MNNSRKPSGSYMETPICLGYANRAETRPLRDWRGRVPDEVFAAMRNSVIEKMVGALNEDKVRPAKRERREGIHVRSSDECRTDSSS